MPDDNKPFYLVQNVELGTAGPEHDLLHPHINSAIGDSVTETQYFGFSVPEARLHALCYLWHRPNLGIITGGVWVWRGIKRAAVHSELFDMRSFMNDSPLKGGISHFTLENSYSVETLEPMKSFRLTYADAVRDHKLDLRIDALSPGVLFADGKHFEQVMKVHGLARIRGTDYEVDCYNVRDRSWGKVRPEDIMPLPPMSWITTVFDDDFSINCNVFDQVEGNPELAGTTMELPVEKTLMGGWVWKDGEVSAVVHARKTVVRAPESYIPLGIEIDVRDAKGREFHLSGRLIASCPWQTWSNVNMAMNLMRWECEGRVTHGDCQEAFWGDYYNLRNEQARLA